MLRENTISIVYDGECPFCKSYCKMTRLKTIYGKVELLNAREDSVLVKETQAQGYDLNQGMVVIFNGKTYYGSEAINILALLNARSDFFNWLTSSLFRSKLIATLAYPILKAYRNCFLLLLKIPQINHHID